MASDPTEPKITGRDLEGVHGRELSDEAFRTQFGGIGGQFAAQERELISQGGQFDFGEGRTASVADAFRASLGTGTFAGLSPLERATAQARQDLDIDVGDVARKAATVTSVPQSGDLAQLAADLGISQEGIINLRRQQAGGITGSEGAAGQLELEAFAEREAIGGDEVVGTSDSFFDLARGIETFAPVGEFFELLAGGGVRRVKGDLPTGSTGAPASSLFTQGTTGKEGDRTPVEGFVTEQLGLTPAEGKIILRTGRDGKNPATGVNVPVGADEIFIEYTDGTFEVRKVATIQEPGEARDISEAGPTAEELGITRRTSIQGGPGPEVTRAPFTARQALEEAQTAEAKDKVLTDEGLASTTEFEFIGKTYQGRTAESGMAFFQNIVTRGIEQRPEILEKLAKPSTSPTILAERGDISATFRAVFGREPTPEEAKYWEGRTDKRGSALIGAMQFAKQQGGAIGGEAGAGVDDPVEAINVAANIGQNKLATVFTEAGVTTASTEKAALRAELDALRAPEVRSLKEFTQDQLATSQFQEASNDLNQAKDSLRQLDADHLSNIEALDQERLPMPVIRRNQTELDIAYNRSRRDLVAELNARSDIVQSQSVIMGMMIDAFKFDTQQAQVEYMNRFNKAMSMYDLVAAEERDIFNIQQKLQDNQRANLSVITGMLAEGTINYDKLTPEAKAQIATMERAVGLTGVSQAIGNTPMPPVISIGTPQTAADGTVFTQIYSQDARTGEMSISTYTSPFKAKVTGTGDGGGVDFFGGSDNPWGFVDVLNAVLDVTNNDTAGVRERPPMSTFPGSGANIEWPPDSDEIWYEDGNGNWK